MRAFAAFIALCLALPLALPVAAQSPTLPPLTGDALEAPPRSVLVAGAPDQRGPSQFLAGDVAVRLVLPESNGTVDPSTEDWTPAQVERVRASMQQALDWWATQLPLARLRFHLRLEVVPTDYEPVRYGLADEGKWIGDTLARLGFEGANYFDQAYAAADALRDELDTDWATTIFVVDSDNGSGYFSDGYFAYAYINGPFMVATSDGGGYGAGRLASVLAHEFGHIFGALDQYYAARISCDRRSGYLGVPTSNSQYGDCGSKLPSIMLEPISAFTAGSIDPGALGQVGYHDADGDGVIDPLDTSPAIDLDQVSLDSTGRPVLRGVSTDLAFPSPLQPEVSINTIRAIEYRVAGSAWQPAIAEDGSFDSPVEQFRAELALYDGSHNVELRAINSAGIASRPVVQQIEVDGVGPQPDYAVSAPADSDSALIELNLKAPANTAAVQLSDDPSFAGAEWQPFAPKLSFELAGPGSHTIYVRFRDAAGLNSLIYTVQTELSAPAPTIYLPLLVR